jgi:hypothetical protein
MNPLTTRGGAQFPVQRSERNFPARSNLQISSVVKRKPVTLCQM